MIYFASGLDTEIIVSAAMTCDNDDNIIASCIVHLWLVLMLELQNGPKPFYLLQNALE